MYGVFNQTAGKKYSPMPFLFNIFSFTNVHAELFERIKSKKKQLELNVLTVTDVAM